MTLFGVSFNAKEVVVLSAVGAGAVWGLSKILGAAKDQIEETVEEHGIDYAKFALNPTGSMATDLSIKLGDQLADKARALWRGVFGSSVADGPMGDVVAFPEMTTKTNTGTSGEW